MTISRILQPDHSLVGRHWHYRESPDEAHDTRELSVVSYETRWRAGVSRADLVGKLLRRAIRDLEGVWGGIGVTVVMRDLENRLHYRTTPPKSMRTFLPLRVNDALISWVEVVHNRGAQGVVIFGAGALDWRRADLSDLGALMCDQTAIGVYFHRSDYCFELKSLLSKVSSNGSIEVSELLAPVRPAFIDDIILVTAYGAFDDEVQAIDLLCAPSIASEFSSADLLE